MIFQSLSKAFNKRICVVHSTRHLERKTSDAETSGLDIVSGQFLARFGLGGFGLPEDFVDTGNGS